MNDLGGSSLCLRQSMRTSVSRNKISISYIYSIFIQDLIAYFNCICDHFRERSTEESLQRYEPPAAQDCLFLLLTKILGYAIVARSSTAKLPQICLSLRHQRFSTAGLRYWPTPWLCSPHLQTLFLHFYGRSPPVEYQRLWQSLKMEVVKTGGRIQPQMRHPLLSLSLVLQVILITITSSMLLEAFLTRDGESWLQTTGVLWCFYYIRPVLQCRVDLRKIILLVQQTYPKSPLLAVGTSIGASILVKYLGEEGPRTPLGGAIAICCPWDLLLCDRFISRIGVQSIYNKALTIGFLQYAQLHRTALARMVD